MSLVQTRWVVIAGAGALAIGVPVTVLGGTTPRMPVPPPITPTPLPPVESGSLAYAVAAPPFDPDRSPEQTAAPGGGEQADAAPAAPLPKLVGLVTGSRGRAIALVRGSNGETVTLSPGQEVDGWRLISAGREQAVFELGDNRETARLDFSNKTSAPTAAPPPSVQGGPPEGPSTP